MTPEYGRCWRRYGTAMRIKGYKTTTLDQGRAARWRKLLVCTRITKVRGMSTGIDYSPETTAREEREEAFGVDN